MKKIPMIAIAVIIALLSHANTKHADRLYEKWEYYKAAKLYEKVAEKHPTQDVYYKLGECYQKMHRYSEAVATYDKVNALGHYENASFYLDYGLMLKTSKRYTDAKNAFIIYSRMAPSDIKGQFYASSCDTIVNDGQTIFPITVTTVGSLNTNSSDLCPIFYKGGLVFISTREVAGHSNIYSWDGEHYLEIMYAKKGNNDTNFASIMPMESSLLNGKYHNGPVCFSRNFDTIYFNRVSRELKGEKKRTLNIERNKIYSAVYKDGKWSDMKPFPYNNDTFSVATPYLTNDGSRIYFASDMPGGYGGVDLYYCNRQGNSWSRPINMGPNINTFGNEKFPSMDSAGNFYFSSDGYKGYGGMDICVSKKDNSGNYGQANALKAPFNSSGDDYGVTFLKTGRIGYFSSNRNGGKGDEDIYYFNLDKDSLPCPITLSTYVVGYKCPKKMEVAQIDSILSDTTKRVTTATTRVTTDNNTTLQEKEEKALARVHFDFDKYEIRPDAKIILDSITDVFNKNPKLSMRANGYCDSRGTSAYNQVLSVHRSEAVVNYLVSKGISRNRMQSKGYGKTNLLNSCTEKVVCTDDEHEQNRRVEMLFNSTPSKRGIVSSGE